VKSKGCSDKLRSVAERSQRGCLKENFFVAAGIVVFDFEFSIGELLQKEKELTILAGCQPLPCVGGFAAL
jgi:hypothetical protein